MNGVQIFLAWENVEEEGQNQAHAQADPLRAGRVMTDVPDLHSLLTTCIPEATAARPRTAATREIENAIASSKSCWKVKQKITVSVSPSGAVVLLKALSLELRLPRGGAPPCSLHFAPCQGRHAAVDLQQCCDTARTLEVETKTHYVIENAVRT